MPYAVLAHVRRLPEQSPFGPRLRPGRIRSGRRFPRGIGPACLRPTFFYVPCSFFSYEVLTVSHMRYITHIRLERKEPDMTQAAKIAAELLQMNRDALAALVALGAKAGDPLQF